MREKLSAFVITYNRAPLLETCLRSASFADEIIVVDKSSNDDSVEIATRYADRVEVVPWSPTVEETRAFALSLCRNDWILCLDDDEILAPPSGPYIRGNLDSWNADILAVPYRHYILGVHDERAYYWPETRHCLFRKGAIEFIPTVHGGVALQSDRIIRIPSESGACIHHLSCSDVASWIERTNRYTSRADRIRAAEENTDLIRFAHDRIDYWSKRTDDASCDDYPTAVALLRAIYDMVDRLKAWEAERGIDGAALLRAARYALDSGISTPGAAPYRISRASSGVEPFQALPVDSGSEELRGMLVQLCATEALARERTAAARKSEQHLASARDERDKMIASLSSAGRELDETRHQLNEARAALGQSRTTLDQTRRMLEQTQASLAEVRRDSEHLSASARLFIPQYLPKLR